jgi:copper chaperone CopZ
LEEQLMTTTTTYGVDGMTCGHCTSAVIEELTKLPGVREVAVELAAGATSWVRVVSDAELDKSQVRDAVEEAGYELADGKAWDASRPGRFVQPL